MSGDSTSRSGVEQRPPSSTSHRLPQQQQPHAQQPQHLHPAKTDEIEILESAGDEQQQDKVILC